MLAQDESDLKAKDQSVEDQVDKWMAQIEAPGFTPQAPTRIAKHGEVHFLEGASTTEFGARKSGWDWIPFIATGRSGIGWVDMFQAGEAYNAGSASPDEIDRLGLFLEWHARERTFGGSVGEIAGGLPVMALEFASGLGLARIIGEKALKTAGGQALKKALTKMARTKIAGGLEENAATRTAGKLIAAGLAGQGVLLASEIPRAPWGRVMANARRLQFQRRFGLSSDEAGQLVVEILADPSSLLDVLPVALIDEMIEFGSEMTGAAIPFMSKLDALHDSVLALFFSKRGLESGRQFLKQHGIGRVWEEIGEEYLGAAAREVVGAVAGVEEFKGQLPETFSQTLEMYVAFGLRGGVGATKGLLGAGADEYLAKKAEEGARESLRREFKAGDEDRTDAEIELLVDERIKVVKETEDEDLEGPPTEEELEELERMETEDLEELLRARGLEEEAEEEPSVPTAEVAEESAEETPEKLAPEEEEAPIEAEEPRSKDRDAQVGDTVTVWDAAGRERTGTVLRAKDERLVVTLDDGSTVVMERQEGEGEAGGLGATWEPLDYGADFAHVATGHNIQGRTSGSLSDAEIAEALAGLKETVKEQFPDGIPEQQIAGGPGWIAAHLHSIAALKAEQKRRAKTPQRTLTEEEEEFLKKREAATAEALEEEQVEGAPEPAGSDISPPEKRSVPGAEADGSLLPPPSEAGRPVVKDFTPKGQSFNRAVQNREKWLEANVPEEQLHPPDRGDGGVGFLGSRVVFRTNDGRLVVVGENAKGDPHLIEEVDPADPDLTLVEEAEPASVQQYEEEGALGATAHLELPTGQALDVTYVIVEAGALTPSHDPTQGFKKNPGADKNERPYEDPTEGKNIRATVEKIAKQMKPKLLLTDDPTATGGPPIVTARGVVVGGNARTMGIQLALAKGGKQAEQYKGALRLVLKQFGFETDTLGAFENPVLVREIIAGQEGAPGELSRLLNETMTTARTATADAVSRGQKITLGTAEQIALALGEDSLSKALGNQATTNEILGLLVASEAFTEKDLAELTDAQGRLTKSGKDTVEQTLLAAVVPDVRALASMAPGHRAKMIAALPGLIRIRAAWPAFAEHMVDVADALVSLTESRLSMHDALRQQTIEAELWKMNPVAVMLANAIRDLGPRKFAGLVKGAANAVAESASGQKGLFEGAVAAEPWEAVQTAFETWKEEMPGEGPTLLDSPDLSTAGHRASRNRRRKPPKTILGSPGQAQAPKAKKGRSKKKPAAQDVQTTDFEALDPEDARMLRNRALLRRFGLYGRDDPQSIRKALKEASLAAIGRGPVEMQGRDNIYNLINDLARRFGLGKPGLGKSSRLRNFALGFYDPSTQGIRLRKGTLVRVYFHELGHHIHRVMFPRRGREKKGAELGTAKPYQLKREDFPRQWHEALVRLGKALYGDTKPAGGYTTEGWAETVRLLIADPGALRAQEPGLYREVVTMLSQDHPETWLVLKEARQRFRAWLVGSARNPVEGYVQRGKPVKVASAKRDRLKMNWIDRHARAMTMMVDLGLAGKLPLHEDPYFLLRRLENNISGDFKKLMEGGWWNVDDAGKRAIGKGLMAIFDPVRNILPLWEDYAIAKRQLEKYAQSKAFEKKTGKKGYVVLLAEGEEEEALADLRKFISDLEISNPEFSSVHAEFQEFNQWMIGDYAVHHGLLTPEAAEKIIAANQEYITFRYATTDAALRKLGGKVGSSVNLGSGVKFFKGTMGEPLLPPIPAYLATMHGIIDRAHKTNASRSLLTLVDEIGSGDNEALGERAARWVQRIEQPIKGVNVKGKDLSREVMKKLGITKDEKGNYVIPGELSGMSEEDLEALINQIQEFDDSTFWQHSDDLDEDRQVVRVLVKGKAQYYQITDDSGLLWEMLKGMYNPTQVEGILKVATMFSRLLRAGATQNNISFGISNVIRDVWFALTLTTTSLKNPRQVPDRLLAVRQAFFGGEWADLYQASGADMEGVFGHEYWDEKTKKLDLSYSFEEHGILSDMTRKGLSERNMVKAVMGSRIIQNVRKGKPGKAALEATMLPLFGRINSRLERMTRMGEFIVRYKEATEEGVSSEAEIIAIAAHAAANITLDWSKGGRHAKMLNQYIPFFNAALLGPDRIAEHFRGAYKKGGTKAMAAAFGRVTSFMVLPSILTFLLNWDDDDYWNIDQRKRDRNWYFPTGRTDAGARTYLRAPKPYGLASWSILTERAFANLFGLNPQTGEFTGDPQAFNWGLLASIYGELAPTLSVAGFQPILEVMAGTQGYDFYWQNEIVPMRDKDLPVGMRGAERSSKFGRMMGAGLGIAPAKVDHLVHGFFAGAGRNVIRDYVDPIIGFIDPSTKDLGPPLHINDWPVVGSIIRRFYEEAGRGRTETIERFYEDWKDVDSAKRGRNRLVQIYGSDDPRVVSYDVKNRVDLERYKSMGRVNRRLAKLWARLRTAYRDIADPDELEREVVRFQAEILETARTPYQ